MPLYEHQKKAVNKMKTGSILCGGVGTGKSRTALAYFTLKVCGGYVSGVSEYSDLKNPVPLYIITTARKRDTQEWEFEAAHFHISMNQDSVAELVVDSWNNIGKYKDVEGAFFIFDEQRLVGSGKWAKHFLRIAKSNDWVVLTATPGDTWSDYETIFVANGFFKNRTQFRQEHVVYSRYTKFPMILRYVGERKLERLRDDIVVYMNYEKTAERHYIWTQVGFDEDSYIKTVEARWDFDKSQPIENPSQYCQKLRQIVNSNPCRMDAMMNALDNRRKAIIFYNYDYELEAIRKRLDDDGWTYSEWNGHKHEDIPTGNRWAYIVQYTAGAEGWNCTTCNAVIFYSLNYSYRTTEQACGRIDRLNTPYTDLYYHFLYAKHTIDDDIRKCIRQKEKFNEKTFAEKMFA